MSDSTPERDRQAEDLAASGEWPKFVSGDWTTHLWFPPRTQATAYLRTIGYAMSIDGYAYAEAVWKISSSDPTLVDKLDSFEDAEGHWQGTFADLRACLFLLQRSIHGAEGTHHPRVLHRRYRALYLTLCERWDREREASGSIAPSQ